MKFEVDTQQVAGTVRELNQTLDTIRQNRITMYRSIEDLNGMWVGDAHDAFAAACADDDAEMQALIKQLEVMFSDISEARQEYDTCEAENQRLAASIQI